MARRLPPLKPNKSGTYESPVIWWFMLLLSTFMAVVFSTMVFPENLRAREVVKEGKYVTVDVLQTKISNFGRSPKHYLVFYYKGYTGNINLGYKFFNLIQGKKEVRLLHLEKFPKLFVPPIMPPDYNDEGQFYSLIILTCFFVFMVPYSAHKVYQLSGK
ncbi:hypothetical protein JAO73_13650 [Hymenobacter sp. BT523]|uniref:hypothetical protein n=1 Tax=Hymenobacter sp. BT523 TaxID=2795725 RepID=UPI0018EAEA85|nr:hypothetical protein [Hymenobacter sp. BT523]MBJ6110062.1 hypothetical protein [Hymenobacter sp. BT523]